MLTTSCLRHRRRPRKHNRIIRRRSSETRRLSRREILPSRGSGRRSRPRSRKQFIYRSSPLPTSPHNIQLHTIISVRRQTSYRNSIRTRRCNRPPPPDRGESILKLNPHHITTMRATRRLRHRRRPSNRNRILGRRSSQTRRLGRRNILPSSRTRDQNQAHHQQASYSSSRSHTATTPAQLNLETRT